MPRVIIRTSRGVLHKLQHRPYHHFGTARAYTMDGEVVGMVRQTRRSRTEPAADPRHRGDHPQVRFGLQCAEMYSKCRTRRPKMAKEQKAPKTPDPAAKKPTKPPKSKKPKK